MNVDLVKEYHLYDEMSSEYRYVIHENPDFPDIALEIVYEEYESGRWERKTTVSLSNGAAWKAIEAMTDLLAGKVETK